MASETFGTAPDIDPETFAHIAEVIRNARVRLLPKEQQEDFMLMLEALQAHLSSEHERITAAGNALNEREAAVAERERLVALKHRALTALGATSKGEKELRPASFMSWRKRA